MVRSAPITPAATRLGDFHSRLQTWTGNFPAIFWMIAMTWGAARSNCGHFSWLFSEACSTGPVGLGRNWYFLLQPHKKSSAKPWCDGAKCRHQQLHPPHRCSLVHIHHMVTYYHLPPPRKRKRRRGALLAAPLANVVHVEAIDGPSESTAERAPSVPWAVRMRPPLRNLTGRTVSWLWFVKSASFGASRLMYGRSPIQQPHTKSDKKTTVQPSTARPVSAG